MDNTQTVPATLPGRTGTVALVAPAPLAVDTTLPKPDLSGYGAAAYTPAQVAAFPKAAITDFKVGLKYQKSRQIGTVNIGTDPAPIFEARFEMFNVLVKEATINQDLLEFQSDLKKGNAYIMAVAPYLASDNPITEPLHQDPETLADGIQNVRHLSQEEAIADLVDEALHDSEGIRPNYVFIEEEPPSSPPSEDDVQRASRNRTSKRR